MIKKKHHSTIASFLLGCMLIVSVPFYGFLHQHHHFDDHVTSYQKQEVLAQTGTVIAFHDCIACNISQVAQTFFVKSTDYSLLILTAPFSFIEKENKLIPLFTSISQGRSPPASFR